MATTLSPAFGDLIRRHRVAAGLTQEELAEKAGLSVRAISDLERGAKHVPRRGTVQLLLDALALSEEDQAVLERALGRREPPLPVLSTSQLRTFLVADIRGYTAFTHAHGDEAAARLTSRFADLVRQAVARWDGEVVELRGDEVLAGFGSARGALRAALDLQRACAEEAERTPSLPMRVGIGLDAGEAVPVEGGYRGGALNLAARLCSLAGPGEVFASDGAIHLARAMEGLVYLERGEVELKGLPDPVRLIQVVRDGEVPTVVPRFSVRRPSRANLPLQPSPFIGRQREVEEVGQLLCREEVRLLTLIGPGGMGKTRLSLQVAATTLDEFEDGVFFVPLASLTDAGLVVSAIAESVGIREAGDRALEETLKDVLGGRHVLLVLDNFEHLLSACAAVADLLECCPRVTALVTSRALLHLAREHSFELPPLAAPDPQRLPDLETTGRYDAVRLFCDRAQAAKAGFALTQENAGAIVEICHRLDGLPLAIELAAARVRVFSPRALLSQLSSRLAFLTGGARDTPVRHQTIRGAIEWSYLLLDEAEQTLFARLAVFAGGCTLDAVTAVCNAEEDLPIDVLDGLSSLVDKSLLTVEEREAPGGEAEVRFVLLETIREYALERLAASHAAEGLRRRHAAYFQELGEEAESQLVGPVQLWWLARLDSELDNIRTALGWAMASEETAFGLRLAGALWRFWYARGHLTEGRRWLEDLLALADRKRTSSNADMSDRLTAQALMWAAALAADQGDHGRAVILADQGLALSRRREDKGGVALSLNILGNVAQYQGDIARAEELFEDGLALFRDMNDRWGVGLSLNNLGSLARSRGDIERAESVYRESLAMERDLGDMWSIAIVLDNLGELAQEQGEYGQAMALHEESLALRRQLGDLWGIADSLSALGLVALQQGDSERAASLYEESLSLYRKVGDKWRSAVCLEGLAGTARLKGQMEQAARLFGAASVLRDTIGHPLLPTERADYDRNLVVVRTALGEDAFAAAWAVGRVMPLDRVGSETVEGVY